ncbi:DUF3800 domain-containing protein [Herbidospora mongoliensis]|uniref:DUF3800 domain-containing protein n=1 Tax=Herbidospora mongoliensis TaxID=688067 RepID=UPI000A815FF0|nr:DUF3800 domain-containing protein [Herbidospora mongoliensis]
MEIGCDESGAEGEKLIGGVTDVFAHAGVALTLDEADACMDEVRHRAPSPITEYKSFVIRRAKHRLALQWLLGPTGPLQGHAHVHLTDKTLYMTHRVTDLIAEDGDRLYLLGPEAFGLRWQELLAGFNDLMRPYTERPIADVFALVDELAVVPGEAGDLMRRLAKARPLVEDLRLRLARNPTTAAPLDPLLPAIVRAVDYWGGGRPVTIVHDRQTTLTEERVDLLRQAGPLAELRLVDSHLDARIQVADLLAGIARGIAANDLHGEGDPLMTGLLAPYVDDRSVWI